MTVSCYAVTLAVLMSQCFVRKSRKERINSDRAKVTQTINGEMLHSEREREKVTASVSKLLTLLTLRMHEYEEEVETFYIRQNNIIF